MGLLKKDSRRGKVLYINMAHNTDTPVIVRQAEEIDIPAIVSLVLTSFRQFPLFNYLYSPLDNDKDNANDTVFFWGRRILLGILDSATSIVVAEVPRALSPTIDSPSNVQATVELESWQMLEWVLQNPKLSQASQKTPGNIIVGFAIWKDRLGCSAGPGEQPTLPKIDWVKRLRS
jgi:hypothetical protein